MQRVRLGIIGCGVIGAQHLARAKISPHIDVVALADMRLSMAQAMAKEHGVPRVYQTGAKLLADPDVDAVVLAVPAGGRTRLALAALRQNKHLLLEKPVAIRAAEVKRMIAARGDRVVACASSRFRSLASAQAATDCFASGVLGELRVIRGRAWTPVGMPPQKPPPPWRLSHKLNGGGILVNWGCYDLDYLLGIVGWSVKPVEVMAQVFPVAEHLRSFVAPESDAETHGIALIRCAGGAVISFERGEMLSATGEGSWQIIGSKASLQLNLITWRGTESHITLEEATADRGLISRPIWSGKEDAAVLQEVVDDFARAVLGLAPPHTGLEQALVMQQITDAIYRSARSGKSVRIS